MSDYLFMTNIGDDIVNSVSISKFVPNRRENTLESVEFKVCLFTQNKEEVMWEKIDEVRFEGKNNITLKSSDYKLSVGQLAVVVPCEIGFKCEKNSWVSSLPEPISRKLDNSPVNERATISFSRGKLKSSYQGEFPYQMSKVKGTFMAFDPLINPPQNNVITKLVFINIFSNKLTNKNIYNLNMADSSSMKILNNVKYVHNSAVIMEIVREDGLSCVFYSKDTLGIPIFISYGKDECFNMSVEHTHPLSELFWGDDKFYGQGLIKSNWMRKLP